MAPDLPADYTLITLDETDSTNAEALRRAGDGAAANTVIVARTQSRGRGRNGAAWMSPPGNLYASLIVAPPRDRAPGQLAFVTAVAAGEAIAEVAAVEGMLGYKWPNDLLLEGRKLAGILIEGAPRGLYVVGLGVNLTAAPDSLDVAAVCLRDRLGTSPTPEALLASFCRRFSSWISVWRAEGFAPVRAAWRGRATGIGQSIEARLPQETVRGVFADVDAEGTLLLDLPDGTRREISAGAIYFTEAERSDAAGG